MRTISIRQELNPAFKQAQWLPTSPSTSEIRNLHLFSAPAAVTVESAPSLHSIGPRLRKSTLIVHGG